MPPSLSAVEQAPFGFWREPGKMFVSMEFSEMRVTNECISAVYCVCNPARIAVGDRVFIKPDSRHFKKDQEQTGMVIRVDGSSNPYIVMWSDGTESGWLEPQHLERVPEKATLNGRFEGGELFFNLSSDLHDEAKTFSGKLEKQKDSLVVNGEFGETNPLQSFRGAQASHTIRPREKICEFSSFSTVRSRASCPSGSKGYYELEIVKLCAAPQFGFASKGFRCIESSTGEGVGDDDNSWGVDGARRRQWHNGPINEYGASWKIGDVIGFACDLDQNQIHVSVNGSFEAPNGLIFQLQPSDVGDGLFAAFTGGRGSKHCQVQPRLGAVSAQAPLGRLLSLD